MVIVDCVCVRHIFEVIHYIVKHMGIYNPNYIGNFLEIVYILYMWAILGPTNGPMGFILQGTTAYRYFMPIQ